MITASLVKELREKTGAGMLDCKKALEANNGDINASVDWLREKGISKAAKKADRIAAEGIAAILTKDNKAVIIEVNSETDFVAKNEEFKSFVMNVAKQIVEKNPQNVEELLAQDSIEVPGKTVNEVENISQDDSDSESTQTIAYTVSCNGHSIDFDSNSINCFLLASILGAILCICFFGRLKTL